jgi:hypothetical protein
MTLGIPSSLVGRGVFCTIFNYIPLPLYVGELLYCLVGCGGSHIQPIASQSGGIRFRLDENIEHSLKVVVVPSYLGSYSKDY